MQRPQPATPMDRLWSALIQRSWQIRKRASVVLNFTLDGQQLRVPVDRGTGSANLYGIADWVYPLLKRLLAHRAGTVIDVGANVGQFLLPLVAIDRSVSYVAIEANPHCCSYLERLLHENHLNGHRVIPVGFGAQSETQTLRFGEEGDPSASLVDDFRPPAFFPHAQAVAVRRGDEVLADLEIDDATLLKIDVEGAELEVLTGLRSTLERQRPAVIFEVLGSAPIRDGHVFPEVGPEERRRLVDFREARARAVEGIFAALDYRLHRIGADGATTAVAAIGMDETEMDYLAWPGESPLP